MTSEQTSAFTCHTSTVVFYKGKLPKNLVLHECGLRSARPMPDHLMVLYGKRGEREGFLKAKEYAAKHKLKFTIVDMTLRLSHFGMEKTVKPTELTAVEMLNMQRISKESVELLLGKFDMTKDISNYRSDFFLQKQLALEMLDSRAFPNVKVVAFPIETHFSTGLLSGAAIARKDWDCIVSASCRLDPEVNVSIAPPPEFVQVNSLAPDEQPKHEAAQPLDTQKLR